MEGCPVLTGCNTTDILKLELDRRKVASAEALTTNFGAYTTAQAEATRENIARAKREEKQRLIDQRMAHAQRLLDSPDPALQQRGRELLAHLDGLQEKIEEELFGRS